VRIAIRAEHEGIPVTTWVERSLARSLKSTPKLQ